MTRELVVEVEKAEDLQGLQRAAREAFEGEVDVEAIPNRMV